MAHNLYLRQSLRLKEIFAGYGGFVTFVKSNAKALSTAIPSIKSVERHFLIAGDDAVASN